jgi:hypothetical protein
MWNQKYITPKITFAENIFNSLHLDTSFTPIVLPIE